MKKFILVSSLLMGVSASVNAAPSNSIEIDIKEMKYQKPNRGVGFAGDLKFTKVNMFRDGMVLALDNKGEIFNSQIFVRPTFIGFKSPYTSVGFAMEEGAMADIESASLKDSRVVINDKYFSFAGELFKYKDKTTDLELSGFRYFCSSHEKYEAGSVDGIIAGCLTDSALNAKVEGGLSGAKIVYNASPETPEDEEIRFQGDIKSVKVLSESITAQLSKVEVKAGDMTVTTGATNVTCGKDGENLEIDADKIQKDCLNNVSLNVPSLIMKDEKEGSTFELDVEKLVIKEERLNFHSNQTAISDEEGRTGLLGLDVDCHIGEDTDVFDVQSIVGDCLKSGKIFVGDLVDQENKKKKKSRKRKFGRRKAFTDIFDESSNKNLGNIDEDDASVRNIKITIENNKVWLSAKVKVLFKFFTVRMEADIEHNRAGEELVVKLTKAKLPLGIKSKKLMLFFIKKFMVSETIEVHGKNIHIKF